MPPKRRSTPGTPNTRSAAKRAGGAAPASVVPVNATGADVDSDDGGSESDASVAEGSHANALALSRIREALKRTLARSFAVSGQGDARYTTVTIG